MYICKNRICTCLKSTCARKRNYANVIAKNANTKKNLRNKYSNKILKKHPEKLENIIIKCLLFYLLIV